MNAVPGTGPPHTAPGTAAARSEARQYGPTVTRDGQVWPHGQAASQADPADPAPGKYPPRQPCRP